MASEVVVVGSLNIDLVVRTARYPQAGETINGRDFATFLGGKGYNQALAAARAGGSVALVGNVGQDFYGEQFGAAFAQDGLDAHYVGRLAEIGTGIANIVVEADGTNRIIIVPGANGALSAAQVERAAPVFEGSRVVLLQLETPVESSIAAARLGRQAGAKVLLTPAPAPTSPLPAELIELVDLVLPNEGELFGLAGLSVGNGSSEAEATAARHLLDQGWRAVLVTLGGRGAAYHDAQRDLFSLGFPVEVVDTTAAGDAFVGALATALAQNQPIEEAMRRGNAAGALACTVPGSGVSLPQADAITHFLAAHA